MAAVSFNGVGLKRILLLVGGAVGVFVGLIPVHLYIYGMLSLESPHFRPASGFAMPDTTIRQQETLLDGRADSEARTIAETASQPWDGSESRGPADAGPVVEVPAASASLEPSGGSRESTAAVGRETVGAESPAGTDGENYARAMPPDSLMAAGADSTRGDQEHLEPLLPFDESKMSRLVAVYEKMRPKQVALILTTMPERQAIAILSGMKDKLAAQVLAELEPSKAARMSELLVYREVR